MGVFKRTAVFLAMLAALSGCSTSRVVERGESYLKNQQWDLAVQEYREAYQKEPGNTAYRMGLERAVLEATNFHHAEGVRHLQNDRFDDAIGELKKGLVVAPSHEGLQMAIKEALAKKEARERVTTGKTLADGGRLKDALKEFRKASELDPGYKEPRDMVAKVEKVLQKEKTDDPLSLASDKPITLNFKNTNIRDAFELLAKMASINVMFDEEVRSQQVTVFAKDVTFKQALRLLLSTNKLLMKKVNRDTIIIIPKNRAKIDQYQDLQIRTFYLSNTEAKDMVNILRTMLETKKILINTKTNSIILRDSPEKLRLAEKIIEANDRQDAEIMLDVEILEVARNENEKIGFKLGATTPAVGAWIKDSVGTIGTSGITLEALQGLGPASYLFVLPSITLDLLKTNSNTKTLASPKLRVIHKKPAKILIGQRVPIQVSTTTTSAGTASGTTSSNFEYRDVGIKLNVEPDIHINNEITMKLGLEVSTLGQLVEFGGGSKQYIFGTRNADTMVQLRDGETTIIAGLIQDDERRTGNRIPGLSDVPVVGRLFAAKDNETVKTDILMSITPHLIRRMELPSVDVQSFWSGTDDTYDTEPVFSFDEGIEEVEPAAQPAPSGAKAPAPPVAMPAPVLIPAPSVKPQVLPAPTPAPAVEPPAPVAPAAPAPQPSSTMEPVPQPPAAKDVPLAPREQAAASPPAEPVPVPFEPSEAKPAQQVQAAPVLATPVPAAATVATPPPSAATQAAALTPGALTLASIAIKPSDPQVAAGAPTGVEVSVGDVKNLAIADISVTYDPEVLSFQNITEGGFLRSDGRPTSFLFSVNSKAGKVDLSLSRVGMEKGVTGSGTLAFLVFQGKKAGSSPVNVKVNKLQNSDRGNLDHRVSGATLTVK